MQSTTAIFPPAISRHINNICGLKASLRKQSGQEMLKPVQRQLGPKKLQVEGDVFMESFLAFPRQTAPNAQFDKDHEGPWGIDPISWGLH